MSIDANREPVYLKLSDEQSHKFYEVTIDRTEVTICYGRIGTQGQFSSSTAVRVVTCTHLGCTVEWKFTQNRFVRPCHGSQYDAQGRVLRGPARRPLPLITAIVKQNQIRLVDRPPAIDPR